jgi:hypothetical protein
MAVLNARIRAFNSYSECTYLLCSVHLTHRLQLQNISSKIKLLTLPTQRQQSIKASISPA